ncbi:MAG: transposase [Candidatus Paceibacteria bacterium]
MSLRKLKLAEGEFYHVYNRGADKRTLFTTPADYQRFLQTLYLANTPKQFVLRDVLRLDLSVYAIEKQDELVAIGAYCLMPNHFHLLITPLVEGGVAKFMNKLGTSYSSYFNKKYDRTGTLFEGRFKAKHASYDEYLKYLYSYIHLNPIKLMPQTDATNSKELTLDFLRSYKYSSYQDYLGIEREEGKILSPAPFSEYFTTSANHIDQLKTWLTYKPDEM